MQLSSMQLFQRRALAALVAFALFTLLGGVGYVLVEGVTIGDYVLVHVGLAISKVDEDEAAKVFEYLREMDELEELEAGDQP